MQTYVHAHSRDRGARKPPDPVFLRNRIQQRISEARHAMVGWRVVIGKGKLVGRYATVSEVCVLGNDLYCILKNVQAQGGPNQYLAADHALVAGKTFKAEYLDFRRPPA